MPGILENATSELVNAGQNNQVPTAPPPAQIDIDSAMKSPIFKKMLPETQQKFLDFATKQNQQSQKEAPPMTTDQWAKLRSGGGLEQSGREPTYNERSAVIKQNAGQPLNFFDRVKAIADDPAKLVPFVGDAVEMNNIKDTIIAAYSYQNGTANDEQMNLLKQYAYKTQIEHANSDFGYKVMNILAGIPSFAGEMASTMGIGNLVKEGVYEGGLQVLKGITEKTIPEMLLQGVNKTATGVVRSLVQTVPMSGLKIAGDSLQRLLPDIQLDNTKKDIAYNIVNNPQPVLPVVLKSFGGAFIDILSQRTAGMWDTGLTSAGKEIAMKLGIMKSFLKVNPDATLYTFGKLIQKTGWAGIVPQMVVTEESKVGHNVIEGTKYQAPSVQDLASELVAFAIPGVAEFAARRIENISHGRDVINQVKNQNQQAINEKPEMLPEQIKEFNKNTYRESLVDRTQNIFKPHHTEQNNSYKMADNMSAMIEKVPKTDRQSLFDNYQKRIDNIRDSGDHHLADSIQMALDTIKTKTGIKVNPVERQPLKPEDQEMKQVHELLRKVPGGDETVNQLRSIHDKGEINAQQYRDALKDHIIRLSNGTEGKIGTIPKIERPKVENKPVVKTKEGTPTPTTPELETVQYKAKGQAKEPIKEENLPVYRQISDVKDRIVERSVSGDNEVEKVMPKETLDSINKKYKELWDKSQENDLDSKEELQFKAIEASKDFARQGHKEESNKMLGILDELSGKNPNIEDIGKRMSEVIEKPFEGEQSMNIGLSSENVKEAIDKAKDFLDKNTGIISAARSIKEIVSPASVKASVRLAGEQLRENLAKTARENDIMEDAYKTAQKEFRKLPFEVTRDIYDLAETGKFYELTKKYGADTTYIMQKLQEDLREEYSKMNEGDMKYARENYLAHIYREGPTIRGENTVGSVMARRRFPGSKPGTQKRYFDTLKEARAAGYEPITEDIIALNQIKLMQMRKWRMAKEYLDMAGKEGLIKYRASLDDVPEGWKQINVNEKKQTWISPEGKPVSRTLRAYGDADVARIINNYLSPGLQGNKIFQALRQTGNLLNQAQLGLSAFHLGFTSIDSMVSKLAIAIKYFASGKVGSGLKRLAEIPLAPITNVIQGDKVLKAWYGNKISDPLYDEIADYMQMAGGRARMDKGYANKISETISELFKKGQLLKGILRVPMEIVEYASKPIMEMLVPRQKLGVFADMMNYITETKPGLSRVEMRREAQKAWDSVDNRMGQLVYDNLFWNRTFKDLLMANVRSVGWNLGTIREIGGAGLDVWNNAFAKKGEKPGFSYRMAYTIALPMLAGLMGAIYQKLRTGKNPGEDDPSPGGILRDLYFPQTGKYDTNGNPDRDSLPTYMKDIYHYKENALQTILNKVNPVDSMIVQMLENKDFYGSQIRNMDDPKMKQISEVFNYAVKQFEPFGIRNLVKTSSKGFLGRALPFVGITPAPYDVKMTAAEKVAHYVSQTKKSVGSQTSAETERTQIKNNLRQGFLNGDEGIHDKIVSALEKGKINNADIKQILQPAQTYNIATRVKSFDLPEVLAVYNKAIDREKELLKPVILTKYREYLNKGIGSEDEKSEMRDRVLNAVYGKNR